MALQRREDEIRMLRLEVAEMARAVDVPKRLLPIIPGVDLDITRIKTQLLETRRQAEELALQLESPANKERYVAALCHLGVGPVAMEKDGGVRLLLKRPLNNSMRCAGLRAGLWGLQQALCRGIGAADALPDTVSKIAMASRGVCSTVKDHRAVGRCADLLGG